MKPRRPSLEKLLAAAARATPPDLDPPTAALEANVLRAWREGAATEADNEVPFALFRRATFTALGVCAGCAAWALLAANPAAATPADLAAYAFNLPWTP
jgi:hypothetical protein